MALADAERMLVAAKNEYQRLLRGVDARLRAAVCQDPAVLAEAQALQASYGGGFTAERLAPLEQPPAPSEDEAKRIIDEGLASHVPPPVDDVTAEPPVEG